jgi:RNA polymerase sigma-70 factor (ECF subfamily)
MDAADLDRLIDAHAAALTLYARQWCATPEDVVQEAFLELVSRRRPPDSPAAWLYRVVRNRAISAARAAARRQRHETASAARAPAWFHPADAEGLDAAAAAEAVAGLPLEEREVVVAHLWGGLTFEAIGRLAGYSAPTAYRRYTAALAALRQQLGVPCPSKPTPS